MIIDQKLVKGSPQAHLNQMPYLMRTSNIVQIHAHVLRFQKRHNKLISRDETVR